MLNEDLISPHEVEIAKIKKVLLIKRKRYYGKRI